MDSVRISRGPTYSGTLRETNAIFTYGAVTLYGLPFQAVLLMDQFGNSHVKGPTTPQGKTPAV